MKLLTQTNDELRMMNDEVAHSNEIEVETETKPSVRVLRSMSSVSRTLRVTN